VFYTVVQFKMGLPEWRSRAVNAGHTVSACLLAPHCCTVYNELPEWKSRAVHAEYRYSVNQSVRECSTLLYSLKWNYLSGEVGQCMLGTLYYQPARECSTLLYSLKQIT
jgi:hypothetical protein